MEYKDKNYQWFCSEAECYTNAHTNQLIVSHEIQERIQSKLSIRTDLINNFDVGYVVTNILCFNNIALLHTTGAIQ